MATPDDLLVARGRKPADLVLRNARIVNVFSGEVDPPADIAIAAGRVVGVGRYAGDREVDLGGRWACPGLIDGHVHLESAMVTPPEFARAVVPRGTTAVVADPHEVANVAGSDGVLFMLEASEGLPLTVFIGLPSCVPASPFDDNGAVLSAADLAALLDHPRVVALGEVMDAPAVIGGDPGMAAKLALIAAAGKPADGHAPGLSGPDLNAYVLAGVGSDHECTAAAGAREKLGRGMRVMIREGSAARDLDALLPIVTPANSRRCLFVTDDRHPHDLVLEGHLDSILRRAIAAGLDPVTAIQMATLNAAEYFGLGGRPGPGPLAARKGPGGAAMPGPACAIAPGLFGAIAPGYRADIVVLDDLAAFRVHQVYAAGRLVAEDGRPLFDAPPISGLEHVAAVTGTCHVRPVAPEDFRLRARDVPARVIEVLPGRIVTDQLLLDLPVRDGAWQADPARDILKVAVVERHRATGRIGKGLVRGFGLRRGALASSVAHDAHNIVAVGGDDRDLAAAVEAVVALGGGLVAVQGGEAVASLPLPLAGLMSDQQLPAVAERLGRLRTLAREWGAGGTLDPFMALAFVSLAVVPELKLTARGLVDVQRGELVR